MELPIQDILRLIIKQVKPDQSVLVGIDGRAGSGKTTLALWLTESIRKAMTSVYLVHTDNFFRSSVERVNLKSPFAEVSDIDWVRLRDQVIIPLCSGQAARFQLYDWPADSLQDWVTIEVGGVTIIDGITATRKELSDYYDLRIWVSCPDDIRVSRLLGRGDTSLAEIEHWRPSEDYYIASHAPEKIAHLCVDSSADLEPASWNWSR